MSKWTLETSEHYCRVADFMNKAGQEVPNKVIEPSTEVRELRAKLILEEALETIKALGFDVEIDSDSPAHVNIKKCCFQPWHNFNLVEVIDGCCDIKVVTTGTLIACGVPDEYAQILVDKSNLQKFGPGGRRREDGKWLKPDDWKAPDWDKFLMELTAEQNGK